MPIEKRNIITRQMLRNEPKTLFVFGDNMQERGLGGQAKEMRGEPNAVGIPTKHEPSMREAAFFSDKDLEAVKSTIGDRFDKLADHMLDGGTVVFPSAGVGTGLADLEQKAPLIWNYIQMRTRALQFAED